MSNTSFTPESGRDPKCQPDLQQSRVRDVLGMWVGPTGGEGAKQWMNMLTELENRGILDVCIVCCDGLRGLPDAILATWPQATVQTCVVHLVRNSLRYASKADWAKITAALKSVYTASTLEAAEDAFTTFAHTWEGKYPAMVAMWRRSWPEFTPFLDFPIEIRKLIYTTNGIVILSQLQGVVDVADGLDRSPIVRAGRAYLQPSSRHGRGRFGVRCSSGGVRLAA